ncbi:MAG: TetR/AcrR family transcriptional regulator, partial [Gammaproteobacteria bacterium]|nr:TetR/AcrR family transcriptional regulator [Gammaproteobacteria bacterium]
MDNQSVVVPMEAAQLLPPQTKRSSLERLRLAARQLFVEDGYDKTRPQDIARLAGLANGTFYLHFKDKKAAFLDFSERAQSDLIQELRVGLDGITGREHRWRVIFAVMETFSERHPGVLEAAFMDPVMIAPN